MRSNWNMRTLVSAAMCWVALLTTGIAAQPPELGAHDVSVLGIRDQDESGKLIEGGVRMELGSRVRFDDETWRLIKQHDMVIRDITIDTPFLTDDVIRWLATQKQLRSVTLSPNFFTDAAAKDYPWDLMPLESLNRLERLMLVDMRISDSAWLAIGRMRTLKSLALYRCRIDSQGSLPLANLKELQSMEIDFSNVDDRFFAGLHELPLLTRLHLGGGNEKKFTVAGLGSLAQTKLKELYLHSVDFGNDGIDALNRISSLQIITGISDSEAIKFEKHPNLLSINKQVRSKADGSPFVDPHAPGERSWALQPSDPAAKSLPATAQSSLPNQPNSKPKAVKTIPLTIEASDNTAGERVKEFAGRKDVLKSKATAKPDTPSSMSLEVKLPDDIETLDYRPNRLLYFYLSVLPPPNGTAKLMAFVNQRTNAPLFLGDLNQLGKRQQDMIERKEGWVVLRLPLLSPKADDKLITIKLTVDANSSAEAYWANPELRLESNVNYEEVDPTKQTIFQSYLEGGHYPYGRLVDAATGKVLKEQIGIGWGGCQNSCLFASDGSHVAIISRHHADYRSNSTHIEKLWLFALRPFRQLQEAESSRFTNIRFAEDNKALLFRSGGPSEVSGK